MRERSNLLLPAYHDLVKMDSSTWLLVNNKPYLILGSTLNSSNTTASRQSRGLNERQCASYRYNPYEHGQEKSDDEKQVFDRLKEAENHACYA